jgi:hypothetical protein
MENEAQDILPSLSKVGQLVGHFAHKENTQTAYVSIVEVGGEVRLWGG